MSSRNDQLVENQQTSRYANERLHSLAGDLVEEDRLIPFLCECADETCLGRVEMDGAEYDLIHLDRNVYSVLPHHARSDGERVIDRRDAFDLVRKSPVG